MDLVINSVNLESALKFTDKLTWSSSCLSKDAPTVMKSPGEININVADFSDIGVTQISTLNKELIPLL